MSRNLFDAFDREFLAILLDEQEQRALLVQTIRIAYDAGAGTIPFALATTILEASWQRSSEIPLVRLAEVLGSGALMFVGFGNDQAPATNDIISKLILMARSDRSSFMLLRYLSALMLRRPEFPSLRRWTLSFLMETSIGPEHTAALPKFGKLHRDAKIVGAVLILEAFGFSPTRHKGKATRGSACDVVVSVLENLGKPISYDAVAAVWRKRKALQSPDGLVQAFEDCLAAM